MKQKNDVIKIVIADRQYGSKGLLLSKISGIPLQFFYHIDPVGRFSLGIEDSSNGQT